MKSILLALDNISSSVIMESQHYTIPVDSMVPESSLFKHFSDAEFEINETANERKKLLNTYAKTIAERLGGLSAVSDNPTDIVSMDIPLLIRLLEYAREEANSDIDLHIVAERLVKLGNGGKPLTMSHYSAIIPTGDSNED